MTDTAERLRSTTEAMASHASVDMALWDRHSNACLGAADEIERLRRALEPFAKLGWKYVRFPEADRVEEAITVGDLHRALKAFAPDAEP